MTQRDLPSTGPAPTSAPGGTRPRDRSPVPPGRAWWGRAATTTATADPAAPRRRAHRVLRPLAPGAARLALVGASLAAVAAACVVPGPPPPATTTTSSSSSSSSTSSSSTTSTSTPPPPTGGLHNSGWLGQNLSQLADWSTELPFADVIKTSRPWTSNRTGAVWGQGGPLAVDADGWITRLDPGQWGELVVFNVQGHYPTGRYTLLWDGTGTLQFADSRYAVVVAQQPGRMEVDIRPGAGMVNLRETATDPADPVRNIRLLLPGTEATYRTQPFNPVFLERLRPFSSLRFTWWARTSAQAAPGAMADWSQRVRPTYAFQSYGGVALEYMVDLANQLGVDPWFNIPHDASDDAVRQYATLVRDRLRPGLRAHVEYSNETWNGGYPQAQWVMDHGTALGLGASPFQAGQLYTGLRSAQVFRIWEDVFGGRSRFVRVLAAQAGNPWTGRQVVAGAGPGNADALAVAPYLQCVRDLLLQGTAGADQVKAMTEDQIIDRCDAELRSTTRDQITQNLQTATANGLQLVAYEGGQHLVGLGGQVGDTVLTAKLTSTNRNPRMEALYLDYFATWRQIGGGRFMNFANVWLPTQYGSWGALEWQDQDPATAPKYRALVQVAAS